MEADGRRLLAETGIGDGVSLKRQADMRLLGQMHEITVDLPDGAFGPSR
jgi:5-oxoprolinase (ATP-hydrolysing)